MSGYRMSEDDNAPEVWQLTGKGTLWLYKYDRREDRWTKHRFGGSSGGGSGRVELTVGERRYNQGRVVPENRLEHDPFTNGRLVRLTGPEDAELDTKYHWTEEHYKTLLELRDMDIFREEVESITNELILRRLYDFARTKATVEQLEFVRNLVTERYPIGGTQRVVQEMLDEEAKRAGLGL